MHDVTGFTPSGQTALRATGCSGKLIAIDIGGTTIKYGLATLDGQLAQRFSTPTEGHRGWPHVLHRIDEIVRELRGEHSMGIAVSTLGVVDPDGGVVMAAADAIPGYVGFHLRQHLEARWAMPCAVENDVNCVALSEGWKGSAQGAKNYITLTVGTGIGGSIVIDGRMYRGHSAAAGEFGNAWMQGTSWEEMASMKSLVSQCSQVQAGDWTGERIFDRYRDRNPVITPVVHQWFERLALGIANLLYALNPELVVLGGAVSEQGPWLKAELEAALRRYVRRDLADACRLELASTGNGAGMLGAVLHWRNLNGH